jgi:hypothetical protein
MITTAFVADVSRFIEGMKMQRQEKEKEQKRGANEPAEGDFPL